MKLQTIQGFFLIDVDVAALNNAGKSDDNNVGNSVATKKIYKEEQTFAYASGQALGSWWRSTLQKNTWETSPVIRDQSVAFTAADPITYPDDDVFGYMRAEKDFAVDEQTGEVKKDAKGREIKENITLTRKGALNTSSLITAASVSIAKNFSTMSRHDGDPVPYQKEEYSGIMKGMFSLDMAQVGTFSNYNRSGFRNINEKLRQKAIEAGATDIIDPFEIDSKGLPRKLLRLPKDIRISRITDTLQALKILSGGAMQTNNLADITPKLIVLATMTTGNHPFSHIVGSEGQYNQKTFLNIDALKEVLFDYKQFITGTVFIGKRTGFWDCYIDQLKQLEQLGETYPPVKFGSIGQVIDEYCKQVERQLI